MDEATLRDAIRQAWESEAGQFARDATELFSGILNGKGDPRRFETDLRTRVMSAGAQMLEQTLERFDTEIRQMVRDRGHRAPDGTRCHGNTPSRGRKCVTMTTVLGKILIRRATGTCRECGRTIGFVDELLGVTPEHLTPACASAAALAAAALPSYAQAEQNLLEMMGVRLDDNRIHRAVARVGPSATRLLREDPENLAKPASTVPPPRRPMYASIDGGRIRMRDGNWREPCAGLIWWQMPDGRLRRFAFGEVRDKERIMEVMDRWLERFRRCRSGRAIIIADGAEWIWKWAERHPSAVLVLDYYHLKSHVWKAAEKMYGEGTARAKKWVKKIVARIWRGQVLSTIRKLDAARFNGWDRYRKRKAMEELATYLHNHQGLLEYRRLRKSGRNIGSGHIESTCKQLFTMRLKGPGMFWSESGAQHVLHLRALYISGRWNELWTDIHRKGLVADAA
jgi:hypothetical protein